MTYDARDQKVASRNQSQSIAGSCWPSRTSVIPALRGHMIQPIRCIGRFGTCPRWVRHPPHPVFGVVVRLFLSKMLAVFAEA